MAQHLRSTAVRAKIVCSQTITCYPKLKVVANIVLEDLKSRYLTLKLNSILSDVLSFHI